VSEPIEKMILSALFHASRGAAREVFTTCTIADFPVGHAQDIAALIGRMMAEGMEVTPMSVFGEAAKESKNLGTYFATQVDEAMYGSPTYCATQVHEAAQRERAKVTAVRMEQALSGSTDLAWVIEQAEAELAELKRSSIHSGPDALDWDGLMAVRDDQQPWVIPGVLRAKEVIVLTGREGGGKSLLCAQLLLGAACGYNTMAFDMTHHQAKRVFVVDVENDDIQAKENMLKVWPFVKAATPGAKPQIHFSRSQNVDLTKPAQRNALIREICSHKPDLVYMGSVYQLAPSPDHDEVFFSIRNTVDAIRDEIGAAFIVEHHAGHDKDGNGVRDSRPYGSSMWRRWPNFGIGLVPMVQVEGVSQLQRWRGDRSRGRAIPMAVKESQTFPWAPIHKDEWDAEYGTKQ
jgi:hypothetical protein